MSVLSMLDTFRRLHLGSLASLFTTRPQLWKASCTRRLTPPPQHSESFALRMAFHSGHRLLDFP